MENASNSPWFSESPLTRDGDILTKFSPVDANFLDLDIGVFEAELNRMHKQSPSESQDLIYVHGTSCGTSTASSECSDDLCIDFEGDVDEGLFDADLHTSILNILDDGSVSDSISLDNIDISDSQWRLPLYYCKDDAQSNSGSDSSSGISSCSSSSGVVPSAVSNAVLSPESTKGRQSSQNSDGKKWSCLSSDEQVGVVEELSHVISNELGLREQLDVIRIINPSASVSLTDREFAIDLETIDDDKLHRIQEYVKLHAGSAVSPEPSPDFPITTQKKSKKQKCQDRRTQQKAVRQRQRKDYRQMMKEKRSGLFVKEEVLALSSCDPGEIEEVDIE